MNAPHDEPKILNLGDLLREAERQREAARGTVAAASTEQAEDRSAAASQVAIYAGNLQDKLARIRAHLQGMDVKRSYPVVYRGNDGYVTLGVVEACALIAAAREAMEP